MMPSGRAAQPNGAAAAPITIRPISVEDAVAVRRVALRPGLPPEQSRFPGDHHPQALHLGLFVGDVLAVVASICPEIRAGGAAAGGWRLSGMATLPQYRSRGLGTRLLGHAIAGLSDRGAVELWCSGRVAALTFYRRLGFEPVGEMYETPGTGPHFVMVRRLGRSPSGHAVG